MRLVINILLVILLVGVLFIVLDSQLSHSPYWPFRRTYPLLVTQTRMHELYIFVADFYEDTGRLPENTKEVHEVTKYFNAYDERGFYVDGWGSPIRYVKKDDGVLIYSIGKNRKDDSAEPGFGDDIRISGDGKTGDFDVRYGRLIRQ